MGMRVPYTRRCHVGMIFFPIVYDFVQSLLSFDNDVLILPDAVSTPIDDGPYISLCW